MRTAQNKLKFDLFSRRFSVYDAARNLLNALWSSGQVTDAAILAFTTGTREARWLFDKNIDDYLRKSLLRKAFEIRERNQNELEQHADNKEWVMKEFEILDWKFQPFLTLSH